MAGDFRPASKLVKESRPVNKRRRMWTNRAEQGMSVTLDKYPGAVRFMPTSCGDVDVNSMGGARLTYSMMATATATSFHANIIRRPIL